MIEIIIIITLGKSISRMAKAKGLSSGKYVTIMVLLWFGLEITGIVIGTIAFGEGLAAYPLGLLGAAIGATLGYQIAKNAQARQTVTDDILDANIV